MTKTDAIRLAMDLGGKGFDAKAVCIRYVGKGYSLITWSVAFPDKTVNILRTGSAR